MTLEDLEKKRLKQRCFYTKEEIKEILNEISLKVVVDELPETGIENYLYLVPDQTQEGYYSQYVWENNEWLFLGENEVDMTDYVTEPELDLAVLEYLPIIEDTRNANVAAITGKAPFATLEAGLKILLHLTYYTPDNSTLNLTLSDGTTTGAKSIVYQADDGTALLVPISNTYGRYKSRLYVLMIYESASSRWICATPVNKNTTYSTTTISEIETGTDTTGKLVSPSVLNTLFKQAIVNTNDSTVTLDANTIYDLGTVTTNKTINLPSTVDPAAEYEFRLKYTSGTISGTAITNTTVANNAALIFTAGKTYQVIISGNILYFSETVTPN